MLLRTTGVSAASAAAIVCFPAVAAAPDPEPLTGSAPRSLSGRYQVPGIIPGDDRPAIRRTMLDDLTGPPKKSSNGGSVQERRYHRTTQVRMYVCKYGEYECSKILPWSERVFGLGETALFLTGSLLPSTRSQRTDASGGPRRLPPVLEELRDAINNRRIDRGL
jgi:hypothetical protein